MTTRKRGPASVPGRHGVRLSLRCSCGSTMSGTVSPATAAVRIRAIFLSVHQDASCVVTDKSEDTP